MRLEQAFERAEEYMKNVPAYPCFVEMSQKFLQDHEGEDSNEMLAQDLGRLISVAWEAGKIQQNYSETSSCME